MRRKRGYELNVKLISSYGMREIKYHNGNYLLSFEKRKLET